MMDKEEYKNELIRMWDMSRGDEYKGSYDCDGVPCCEECALYQNAVGCGVSTNAFEMIEAVEKWAKENPPKKFKVSRMEYDILQEVYSIHGNFRMYQNELINNLREKGCFKGADEDTEIDYYLKNCEIVDDD